MEYLFPCNFNLKDETKRIILQEKTARDPPSRLGCSGGIVGTRGDLAENSYYVRDEMNWIKEMVMAYLI